ncbi:soluble scavenger receptor cysteine-rich domain-containing protein SSC5D-like [Latimeria chalumnae]|uniref:soluble scavenger receptor cysteine-rich domain-containing protein SSC5D-like n=1 Tax=Latimeria chalumnae TaxID=7897 RepID=UPI00313D2132
MMSLNDNGNRGNPNYRLTLFLLQGFFQSFFPPGVSAQTPVLNIVENRTDETLPFTTGTLFTESEWLLINGSDPTGPVSTMDSGSYTINWRASPGVPQGRVRLVDGPHRCGGRVEVYHNGEWGTVCDDDWGIADAEVVCREIGCGPAVSAPGSARFGQGSGRIWLDDVACTAAAASIFDCKASSWGSHNCGHGEDAGIVCSVTEIPQGRVRLVDGPHRCAGRVEVYHSGEWGTVCDDGWGIADAEVVCREIGCGSAVSAPGSARFGQGPGRIWLDDVACTAAAASIFDCKASLWGSHNCGHGEDAGVVCSGKFYIHYVAYLRNDRTSPT